MPLKPKRNRRDRPSKQQAIDAITKEDTKRLNANIPITLHDRLKIQAIAEKRNATDIIIEALLDYLRRKNR